MKLNLGDKIEIIDAGIGAMGANGCIGIVTSKNHTNGIDGTSLRVEIIEPSHRVTRNLFANNVATVGEIWGISTNGYYKVIERFTEGKKFIGIDVVVRGNKTTALVGGNVGVANKNNHDEHKDYIGATIAILRAFEVDEEVIGRVVDAFYDEQPNLENYSSKELLRELHGRIVEL